MLTLCSGNKGANKRTCITWLWGVIPKACWELHAFIKKQWTVLVERPRVCILVVKNIFLYIILAVLRFLIYIPLYFFLILCHERDLKLKHRFCFLPKSVAMLTRNLIFFNSNKSVWMRDIRVICHSMRIENFNELCHFLKAPKNIPYKINLINFLLTFVLKSWNK